MSQMSGYDSVKMKSKTGVTNQTATFERVGLHIQ